MGVRWCLVSMLLGLSGCASAPPRVADASLSPEVSLCGAELREDTAMGPVRDAPVGDRAIGQPCGAGLGACMADGVCVFPEASPCGDGGVAGVCEARPTGCQRDCPRVCACGGETFCNACVARARGFSVRARGRCPEAQHEAE
jgi:hypothetical protein